MHYVYVDIFFLGGGVSNVRDLFNYWTPCKMRWSSTYEMFKRLDETQWSICVFNSVLYNCEYTKLGDASTLDMKNKHWFLVKELVTSLKALQVTTSIVYKYSFLKNFKH